MCTSALTALPAAENEAVKSSGQFATRSPIDHALAEIDISLGLACSIPPVFAYDCTASTIEDELGAVLAVMREQRGKESAVSIRNEDTASCVSGTGALGQGTYVKAEDSSPAIDLLHELFALDSRTSTTVTSPPLVKSLRKRRRRR